jgi:putative transposase
VLVRFDGIPQWRDPGRRFRIAPMIGVSRSAWGPRTPRRTRRGSAPLRPVQLSFADRPRKDGRPRRKPGRRAAEDARIRHRTRPAHKYWNPTHVTLRAIRGLPSFRNDVLYAAFERAFRRTVREDFRIVEFSVQTNHVHLIIEAEDNGALARGMKSFTVRANRLLNAALGRGRGRVWGDRYHRHDLTCPRAVRNALVYCLGNYKKHYGVTSGMPRIDPFSSARWFEGWVGIRTADDGPRPTPRPVTVLLATRWQKHGLIHPGEYPRQPLHDVPPS